MPRARQEAADDRHERPAAPAPVADAPLARDAAALLRLQATAGNQAVTRSLARRALLQREPAGEGPSPGVDHATEAGNVTITFVLRDFNLPPSGDTSTVDFLHEPGVSIQVSPKQAPEPVVQAAIAAMNVHLARHGKDLVEISVGPQAAAGGGNNPSVGAQLEAEIHVSSTFSFTASTSIAAAAPEHGKEPEDESLRLSKPGASVDITWSPMSLGVLYKLGGKEPPREEGKDSDYYAGLTAGKGAIGWVASQLDRSEFTPRGGGEPLDVNKIVTDLFDAMLAARGDEAQFNADLGVMQEADWPPGLTRGLARAAQLLVRARPDFARLRGIRLALLNLPPDGKGPARVVRWKQLPLETEAVTPPAGSGAPASPGPQRTWGTGPPVTTGDGATSGPMVPGRSRVIGPPPPLRGVPAKR